MSDLSVPISAGTTSLDPNLANGTCYFAIDSPHTGNFLPCGNAAGGEALPCCFAGDMCLSSNACYDAETDLTYIAGCTDSTYQSWSCPYKSKIFESEEWVAVTWSCSGSSRDHSEVEDHPGMVAAAAVSHNSMAMGQTGMLGDESNDDDGDDHDDSEAVGSSGFLNQLGLNVSSSAQAPQEYVVERRVTDQDIDPAETIGWVGCPIQVGTAVPESLHGMCDSCLASLNGPSLDILFKDSKKLTRIATLPQEMGGVVLWDPGFEPSSDFGAPPATTSMTTCASTMTGTGGAAGGDTYPTGGPNTMPTGSAAVSTHPGNSQMNIIVGATSACVIVLLLGALVWLLWKRHQRHKQEKTVIREQHMALARGPSPPRIPTAQQNSRDGGRNGPGMPTTPNLLVPIKSIRDAVRGSTTHRRGSSQLKGGNARSHHQRRLSTATTETNGNSMYMVPSNPASISAAAGIATPLAPSPSIQALAGQDRSQPEEGIPSAVFVDTSLTAASLLLKTRSRSNTFGRSSPPRMNVVGDIQGGSPRSEKAMNDIDPAEEGDRSDNRGFESLSRQSSMTPDTIQEARRLQVHVVDPSMARVLLLGEKSVGMKDED